GGVARGAHAGRHDDLAPAGAVVLRHGDLGVAALGLGKVDRAVGRRLEVAVQAAAEAGAEHVVRVDGKAVRGARAQVGGRDGLEGLRAVQAARAGGGRDLVVAVVDDVGVEGRRHQHARLGGDDGLVVRGGRLARLAVHGVPRGALVVAGRDGVAGELEALVDVEHAVGGGVDVDVGVARVP